VRTVFSFVAFHLLFFMGQARGLNSPAGPVLASAWSGLRDVVHASPRPAGQRAFLEPAWSGLGRPAGRVNE